MRAPSTVRVLSFVIILPWFAFLISQPLASALQAQQEQSAPAEVAGQRWEYLTEQLEKPYLAGSKGTPLNLLAHDGWELVATVDHNDAAILILRRPRQAPEQ